MERTFIQKIFRQDLLKEIIICKEIINEIRSTKDLLFLKYITNYGINMRINVFLVDRTKTSKPTIRTRIMSKYGQFNFYYTFDHGIPKDKIIREYIELLKTQCQEFAINIKK